MSTTISVGDTFAGAFKHFSLETSLAEGFEQQKLQSNISGGIIIYDPHRPKLSKVPAKGIQKKLLKSEVHLFRKLNKTFLKAKHKSIITGPRSLGLAVS